MSIIELTYVDIVNIKLYDYSLAEVIFLNYKYNIIITISEELLCYNISTIYTNLQSQIIKGKINNKLTIKFFLQPLQDLQHFGQ